MDYTNNERVKRVLYTIYHKMKGNHPFNTTIYHTGQERGYKTLSTYFNSTTYHHITLPQDERTTTNNIFTPERPQPIKCRTIYHRWNYTTIQNHFNITGIILQDKKKHLFQRQRRIFLCRLICFLMHCNEEDKQSIKENHRQRYRTLLNATTSILHTSTRTTTIQEEIIPFNMEEQHTGAETTSNYFNMDNQQTGRAIIFPISHYKETSRTTTTNRIKRTHTANKTLLLQLYTLQ